MFAQASCGGTWGAIPDLGTATYLSMVMAVITIVVFAFGLGGKIKEVDWNKTFKDFGHKIETPAE